MSKGSNRTVYQRADKVWVNKVNGAERASSLHRTQGEAWDAARNNLQNQGGGELTVMGRNHLIVSKDTIVRPDPNPPKDREH